MTTMLAPIPDAAHNFCDLRKSLTDWALIDGSGVKDARWLPKSPEWAIFRCDALQWLRLLPSRSVNAISTDPPYFLSNGGTTCSGGKRVNVHKGDWDESQGAEKDHQFFLDVLRECQRILKPDGSMFISGTHHCIYSIGYAMKKLGMHVLNDIPWTKTNPPPNIGCRQLTDDHETIIWASPRKGASDRLLHKFNYDKLRQMNLVPICKKSKCGKSGDPAFGFCPFCGTEYSFREPKQVKSTLRFPAATSAEKWYMADVDQWLADDGHYWFYKGKAREDVLEHGLDVASSYPAQKPTAMLRYILSMVTDPGDIILDPFMGSCATGVVAGQLGCLFLGNDLNQTAFNLSGHRLTHWREHESLVTPQVLLA